MVIEFFNFSKRPNSTKQVSPSDTSKLTISNAYLKDGTSFQNPTIILKEKPNNVVFSPSAFNYCSIPYWERYYFVTDWRWENGVWEVDLKVDVLASFKTAIGNTSAYIIRAAGASNGNITDTFYPSLSNPTITKQSVTSDFYHTSLPLGCYVLGCINAQSSNRVGAVTYYALTEAEMSSVLAYLFSGNIYSASNITEVGQGLYMSMFNPFQYIVSCMWFPYAASVIGTTQAEVKVGYWGTGVTGLVARYIVKEIGFKSESAIAAHPQAATRGSYLNRSPYTRLTLYYPPFGEIPIDPSYMIYTNNYLYGKIYVDFITGIADIRLTIASSYDPDVADPYLIQTIRTAQVGVPIQLAQVISDYMSGVSSAGAVFSSALSGNIAGVFGNIASAVSNMMPKLSTSGANGSLIAMIEKPYLVVEHYSLVTENNAEFGRPLCATRTINGLSGYIKTGEADHDFGGTDSERKEINRYLQEGFFYE